ncbi:DMT family transporter [Aurantimonas sp. C2-6-R+9]|uniref:DMT family transporter n=1 Tax=unclassified Aurantimonas TaxID=2638230 RepID=UPI002E18BF73|nr:MULTISPECIES: DMT family transporter [unclassified Aurantimonas]MEC5291677.1 DMT family transporter [Aurantimonas sp. C2-3-R2]MEC5381859.1 DMT family transporter [Aurantimonas sp. C2-6-R+9]MEC5412761.1 DMT family transporter [Aurantimonas sp. C2-4-R8]
MFSDNIRAAIFMLVAMAGFVVNDTFVKLTSEELSPPQIMAVRGVAASLLLFLLAWRMGALRPMRLALQPRLLLRTGADFMATLSYLTGLSQMPIANASAIFQALPLTVTLGAAVFLHEPVGWRRWAAIGVGFVGVIIIVRPGTDGFSVYSLSVLAAVVFSAIRDLATRRMDRAIPSLFISLMAAVAVSLLGWILIPFTGGWQPVSAANALWLSCAAVSIIVGYIFIVQSMRTGDMGFVAPFRYSVLLYALVIGVVVFDDWPSTPVLLGSAIVVASGLYTLYRERVRGVAAPLKSQIH